MPSLKRVDGKRSMRLMLAFGLPFFLLTGCNGDRAEPETALVGVYAVQRNGQWRELLKIERDGEGYLMRDKRGSGSNWSEPRMRLAPVRREDWRQITGDTADTPFIGVANDKLGVFKAPPNWSKDGFRTESGYFMFHLRGSPVELRKQ